MKLTTNCKQTEGLTLCASYLQSLFVTINSEILSQCWLLLLLAIEKRLLNGLEVKKSMGLENVSWKPSKMNPVAHSQESHVSVTDKQLHLSQSGQESLCLVWTSATHCFKMAW
jgi:hypothetical protein